MPFFRAVFSLDSACDTNTLALANRGFFTKLSINNHLRMIVKSTVQARDVKFSVGLLVTGWALLIPVQWAHGRPKGTVVSFLMVLVHALGYVYLWVVDSEKPARWVIHSAAFFSSLGLVFTALLAGGTDSAAVWLFPIIPVFVGYHLGAQDALVWIVISIIFTLIGHLSPPGVLVITEFTPDAPQKALVELVMISILGGVTLSARRIFESQLEALIERENKITQQAKELEIARDEALLAAKAKGEFLATMSHELRTPLHAVVGLSSLMSRENLSTQQRSYMSTIRSSARALLDLIGDILDFSKLDAGRVEIESTDFDLYEILDQSIDQVSPQADQKKLSLVLDVSADSPRFLTSDPARIRQVLVNLLSNAIKFTESGAIVVKVVKEQSVGWSFSVIDSGIGIAEEKLPKLFQMFSQADASTNRRFGGTGLGLALSQRIVVLLGGRIEVKSKLGQGSTFTVHLPLTYPQQTGAEASLSDERSQYVAFVTDKSVEQRGVSAQLKCFGINSRTLALQTIVGGELALGNAVAPARGCVLLGPSFDEVSSGTLRALLMDQAVFRIFVLGQLPNELEQEIPESKKGRVFGLPLPAKFGDVEQLVYGLEGGGSERQSQNMKVASVASRVKVLVADDNPVNLMVVEQMLKQLGHEYESVTDGQQVIERLRKSNYDIVFLDTNMPVLDGLQAAQAILDKYPERYDRPILIALTAHADVEHRRRCFEVGFDEYLSKPFLLGELEAVIENSMTRITSLPIEPAHVAPRKPISILPNAVLVDVTLVQDVLIDAELWADLVPTFETHARQDIVALRTATEQNDLDNVKRVAHKLKGAASQLGATTLSDLCSTIERQANAKKKIDSESVNILSAVLEDTVRVLKTLPQPAN